MRNDSHYNFGRLEVPDQRDLNYGISPLLMSAPQISEKFWWDEGWWGNQGQTNECFLGGSVVTMGDGTTKNLKDIVVGDEVITHLGNIKPVTAIIKNKYVGELLKISYKMNCNSLYCTPDHPFYVSDIKIDWTPSNTDTYGKLIIDDTGWVKSKSLKNSRYYLRQYVGGYENKINSIMGYTLTPKLGRLVGLYLAEGYYDKPQKSLKFAFHTNETEYHDFVLTACKDIFNCNGYSYQRLPDKCVEICIYDSGDIIEFFDHIGSRYSHKKELPNEFMQYPVEFLDGIITGFHEGDGWTCRETRKWVLTTTSHTLATQLHRIMLSLGYNSSLQYQDQKNRKRCYRIYRYNIGPSNRRIRDGNFLLSEVKTISRQLYDGYVYNLEVADDESYLIDDIAVHNCVAYSWSHWLEDGPILQDNIVGRPKPVFDPYALYKACQKVDSFPGEDYSGTTVRAGAAVLKDVGLITEYRWAFTVDEIIMTLLTLGPMVVGTRWYYKMQFPDGSGLIRPKGRMLGGHAYLLNGVDIKRGYLRIKNSWGRDWGHAGHAYISISDFEKVFKSGGEACIAAEVKINEVPSLDWIKPI